MSDDERRTQQIQALIELVERTFRCPDNHGTGRGCCRCTANDTVDEIVAKLTALSSHSPSEPQPVAERSSPSPRAKVSEVAAGLYRVCDMDTAPSDPPKADPR